MVLASPVHRKATLIRPRLNRASVADPQWRAGILRSSCGHAIGVYAVLGSRQAALQWKVCR